MIDRRIRRSMIFAVGASDIGFLLLLLILIKLNINSERFGVNLELPAAPAPRDKGYKLVNTNRILVTERRKVFYFTGTTRDSLDLASIKGDNRIVHDKTQKYINQLIERFKSVSVDVYVYKNTPFGDLAQLILTLSQNNAKIQLVYTKE